MNRLSSWIQDKCYFKDDDITKLYGEHATRKNIEEELISMVEFAHMNKDAELWFSYSGHGSKYFSMTEKDFQNEVLCPSDYLTKGFITDDWLKKEFIDCLPVDCKLFVLMDCCHSGSNMDLPYYLHDHVVRLRDFEGYPYHDSPKVVKFSGCMDSQVSMDYFNRNMREFQGAFTNSFIQSHSNKSMTLTVEDINDHLSNQNFKQISELSLSQRILSYWRLYEV